MLQETENQIGKILQDESKNVSSGNASPQIQGMRDQKPQVESKSKEVKEKIIKPTRSGRIPKLSSKLLSKEDSQSEHKGTDDQEYVRKQPSKRGRRKQPFQKIEMNDRIVRKGRKSELPPTDKNENESQQVENTSQSKIKQQPHLANNKKEQSSMKIQTSSIGNEPILKDTMKKQDLSLVTKVQLSIIEQEARVNRQQPPSPNSIPRKVSKSKKSTKFMNACLQLSQLEIQQRHQPSQLKESELNKESIKRQSSPSCVIVQPQRKNLSSIKPNQRKLSIDRKVVLQSIFFYDSHLAKRCLEKQRSKNKRRYGVESESQEEIPQFHQSRRSNKVKRYRKVIIEETDDDFDQAEDYKYITVRRPKQDRGGDIPRKKKFLEQQEDYEVKPSYAKGHKFAGSRITEEQPNPSEQYCTKSKRSWARRRDLESISHRQTHFV